jgi:hypothetical protein
MAQDMAVAEALYQHVLGAGDPSGTLVESGTFPPGWVEEYRRLLQLAESEWLAKPLWPKCMAAAMYYVVTHLVVRYRAWCSFEGGGRRNEETERALAAADAPTRLFFAQAFSTSK